MWVETVSFEGPYHFDQVLDRLSMDPVISLDVVERTVKVPLVFKHNPYVFTIKAIGTIEEPRFEISGHDEDIRIRALTEINRIFQWDFSLKVISLHFQETNLSQIFSMHAGTPLVLEFDLYSCLMKSIIHQQLNLKFAHMLTNRFVTSFGYQVDDVWFYPSPKKIAELDYEQLTNLQFSRRKAEYVIDTSRLVENGTLNLEKLDMLSDDEVVKELVKVRGIGPWTAQSLLLSGLGRPNLFPKADIGIQKAIQKHFNLEKKPTSEEMDIYSEKWTPYLSYATLYLWRSIE
ncbi:DNA-3-methyladenine glycosylase II [Metabacillus crassostreae]|uniref:DNA-3-methyladenine glycosylase family protein n=1 Tax=Metabacillus crassostreae TaxID=929098 RepID=UPI00195C8C62|nr:DNA-3-methyladenine glycosylase [Metabacillus crassostreae]MBM7605027.1 DNA-3-methyladenine glycosylase II [Metabacillus crassostreae]